MIAAAACENVTGSWWGDTLYALLMIPAVMLALVGSAVLVIRLFGGGEP